MKKILLIATGTLTLIGLFYVVVSAQTPTGGLGGSGSGQTCNINNSGDCNNGGDASAGWAPEVTTGTGTGSTSNEAQIVADLKFCKTVTAANAAYCCNLNTGVGTATQCKPYITTATVEYCKNLPAGDGAFNFCCTNPPKPYTNVSSCNNRAAILTERTNSVATSPNGRYSDKDFCSVVTQYNAAYCCGASTAGGTQCRDYNASDKTYKTTADNLFCSGAITDENSKYCCNVARIGDLVQCSVANDTVLKYSRETIPGVNVPDGDVTYTEGLAFCSPLESDNANYCCNTTSYATINDCKKFIKSGGLRGANGEGAAKLLRAQESCSVITQQNGEMCCVVYQIGAEEQCKLYLGAGTVGGVNGGTQITTNTVPNGFLGSGSVAQPQASAAELKACTAIKFVSLLDIVIWVKCIITSAVIPLIFTLAFVVFLWGIFRFISSSDKTKKEDAKNYIIWGMVGLFVMVSLWGIIKILGDTLGIQSVVPLLKTEYLPNSTTKATTK